MTNEQKSIHRILIYPWFTFGLVAFWAYFVESIINRALFEKGLSLELIYIFFFIALVLYQIYFFKFVGYKRRKS